MVWGRMRIRKRDEYTAPSPFLAMLCDLGPAPAQPEDIICVLRSFGSESVALFFPSPDPEHTLCDLCLLFQDGFHLEASFVMADRSCKR